jgi:hypothetical protein
LCLTCPSFFFLVVFSLVFHSLCFIYHRPLISYLCLVCVVPTYKPLTC